MGTVEYRFWFHNLYMYSNVFNLNSPLAVGQHPDSYWNSFRPTIFKLADNNFGHAIMVKLYFQTKPAGTSEVWHLNCWKQCPQQKSPPFFQSRTLRFWKYFYCSYYIKTFRYFFISQGIFIYSFITPFSLWHRICQYIKMLR